MRLIHDEPVAIRAELLWAGFDPDLDAEGASGIQPGRVRDGHKGVDAIQAEGRTDLAGGKSGAVDQGAVVRADGIEGIIIGAPPGEHARRGARRGKHVEEKELVGRKAGSILGARGEVEAAGVGGCTAYQACGIEIKPWRRAPAA